MEAPRRRDQLARDDHREGPALPGSGWKSNLKIAKITPPEQRPQIKGELIRLVCSEIRSGLIRRTTLSAAA